MIGKRRTNKQTEKDIKSRHKICAICGINKPFDEYRRDTRTRDGYKGSCKLCLSRTKPGRKIPTRRTPEELQLDIDSQTKICTKCLQRQPFDNFRLHDVSPDKKASTCKVCQSYEGREQTLKVYGISVEDYDKMFANQEGVCAICGSASSKRKGDKHLVVDHNHKTGKVRGLLCIQCNAGLGMFEDDVNIIHNAEVYLQ